MTKFVKYIKFEGINERIKETLSNELGYSNIKYLDDICDVLEFKDR